jgi:uncharacterized protein (DUF2062 family)
MKKIKNKLMRLLKLIYLKLFRIHDTPQRISIGLGLGVFLGILPGTGPIASLALALIFRVNRAAALLGCIITNTWLSFITFFLSIKLGSTIMNLNWMVVRRDWIDFLKGFKIADLFRLSAIDIILPVILGYFVIGLCCGLITYLVSVIILINRQKQKRISEAS